MEFTQMFRPSQPDLLSEIFIAYSQMKQIFNSQKYKYECKARYHRIKQQRDLVRDSLFQNSDTNPLRPLEIRSKK